MARPSLKLTWVCVLPARGCYSVSVVKSGVCREARDGACERYAKKHMVDDGRHGTPVGVRVAGQCTDVTNQQSCEASSCNVQIGSNVYCSQCKTGRNVPIDGVCVDKTAAVDKCLKADGQPLNEQDTTCGQCGDSHFLFKGGCSNVGTEPGNKICSAVDEANTAVCKTCVAGYFKNPTNVETSDSCIACGDATGVQAGSATYKGVANCAACTAPQAGGSGDKPATCTKCGSNKYLKVDGTECLADANACTTPVEFGKEDNNAGNKCISCGDEAAGVAGCNTCTYDSSTKTATCTKCTDKYLKTVDGTTTCVIKGDCNGGYFPNDNVASKKQCILCGTVANNGIDSCTECALLSSPSRAVLITCSACVSGKKPNTDGSQCIACDIDGCVRCNEASKCSQCGDSYRLDGETCVSTSPLVQDP